jgi:hypothetical protein
VKTAPDGYLIAHGRRYSNFFENDALQQSEIKESDMKETISRIDNESRGRCTSELAENYWNRNSSIMLEE